MPRTKAALTESQPKANSNTSAKAEMPKAKATKKGARGESSKKKKDPNAPKRSLSAYMFFANKHRKIVREKNPGISFGEVGRILGRDWKKLEAPERKEFEDQAQEDKERYEAEKAAYQNRDEDEDEDEE